MAGFININIQGEAALSRALERAEKAVSDEAVQIGLVAGALIVQNDAKRRAPFKTGTLKRSLKHESIPVHRSVTVGTDLPYAAMQEYGGTVRPRNKRFLRFVVEGQEIFTKGPVKIPAHPYLRPALRENTDEVREIVMQVIKTRLQAAMV